MAIRTLNHIYVVDRIFRAPLLCQKHGHTATNTPDIPDIPDTSDTSDLGVIHFAVAETDIWFERYAPGMRDCSAISVYYQICSCLSIFHEG